MNWLAALVGLFCTGSVFALSLGEIEGHAVIGHPLRLTVPILGAQGNMAQTDCATLLPDADDDGHDRIRVRVEGDRVHVSTAQALTQPILRFRIRIGCSGSFDRGFVVLPDPPSAAKPVVTPPTVVAEPAPPAPLAAPVAGLAAAGSAPAVVPKAAPAAPGQPAIVLESSTSLRMLSRQRYPGDSRARVNFIWRLATANPDLFASPEAAFDQRLAAGTRLLVPARGLPVQRESDRASTKLKAVPESIAPQRQPPARPAGVKPRPDSGAGGGRLIVGGANLSAAAGPTRAELNESIERLAEVMNQQVTVEISLTERIKAAEADLTALKQQVVAAKLRAAQLESELRSMREAEERSATIQLVLAILLSGVAGAWVLNWMSRRKAAANAMVVPAPIPMARTPAQPVPSTFDNLLDAREDILAPQDVLR